MKAVVTITLSLALSTSGFAQQAAQPAVEKPAAAPCPLCELPNRAAILAGRKCPEGCAKLCCTGTEANYVVKDMTCANCSGKVKAALAKLEGVQTRAVCHKSGHAVVKYDPAKIKPESVIAAINATGFNVVGEKVRYQVTGMTCAGCSRAVEKVLAEAEGVTKVESVCHQSGQATVVFDPAKTSKDKIAATIDQTKFKVAKEDRP